MKVEVRCADLLGLLWWLCSIPELTFLCEDLRIAIYIYYDMLS